MKKMILGAALAGSFAAGGQAFAATSYTITDFSTSASAPVEKVLNSDVTSSLGVKSDALEVTTTWIKSITASTAGLYSFTFGGTSDFDNTISTWQVSLTSGSKTQILAQGNNNSIADASWTYSPPSALTLGAGMNTFTLTTTSLYLNPAVYKALDPVTYASLTTPAAAAFTTANISIAAVPGPIAGAGLPALLGLAGFMGLRRRKVA